jgi:hypothetical protein
VPRLVGGFTRPAERPRRTNAADSSHPVSNPLREQLGYSA